MAPNAGKTFLKCECPQGLQDAAKTPRITNTTGKVIKKNTVVHWTSSDNDKEDLKLTKDLPPNGTVLGLGKPTSGFYTCQAWIPTPIPVPPEAKRTVVSSVSPRKKRVRKSR